ncbi:hypothetical protein GCM10010472_23170 [Pseudonocardia halophobica]|uniref:Blue (type 1) copper domain-containing protein n=1 Tax=Pseudonocardia halophobica TaxID=29401 RepID=A0A9W6NTR6_9PSEU|nr:hypothetical protein [Pseudonocardia halophobica]GLL09550.1 hypothetical protein GCM10017577_06900 [Pseudonocardia halophobica]
MHRAGLGLVVVAGVAAIVLGAVSTVALAALSGAFLRPGPYPIGPVSPSASCAAPALPGAVVDVRVTEMGTMMGSPDGNGPGPGRWYRGGSGEGQSWPPGAGWMDMTVIPTAVRAGEVSLRVTNSGWRPHELVVLPLAVGRAPGGRPIGADGRVDETGSIGEASAGCAAGIGDGILPGAAGWTTLTLGPGRYELICNYAGHYHAGMYAELDVT